LVRPRAESAAIEVLSDGLEDFLGLAGLVGSAAKESLGDQGANDAPGGRAVDAHVEAITRPTEVIMSGRDCI
jgi:hypothetical protein